MFDTLIFMLASYYLIRIPLIKLMLCMFSGINKVMNKLSPKTQLNIEYTVLMALIIPLTLWIHSFDENYAIMFCGGAILITTVIYGALWQKHNSASESNQDTQLTAGQARYAQLYAEYGIEQAQTSKVNAGR